MARYWHTRADLDEAARHAHHALRLGAAGAGSAGLTVHAMAALTVAGIDRDLARYPASHARLIYVISVLDAAPPTVERDRLLAWALTDLGDCHRRAGRYPQATSALRRARGLIENGDPPDPALMRAVLTMLGIIAKEVGAYDEATQCYAEVASTFSRALATCSRGPGRRASG
jgi:tetratricopeptide (TPR) repeat protein